MKLLTIVSAAIIAAAPAFARDQVQVAGSSTVLPYASIVAEAFGENFDFQTPVIESGGSSAGLKRFCQGVGVNTLDIANASRQIREKEIAACAENGVNEIVEVRIGYDGIVFSSLLTGPEFHFTPKDIYLALHADSEFINWNQVNPAFPDQDILAFVPGTKHGTREVFEEKVMLVGCEEVHGEPADDTAEDHCMSLRTDGRAVDIDGDYTETLASINANPQGIGVFGLAFYENNTDKLRVANINNVTPSKETISTGEYPVSRPLFFYIKKAHIGIIPGLQEFAMFFVSDEIAGDGGPLSDYGLVPDPALAETQSKVESLEIID